MTAATGMAEDTRASTVKLALLEAEVNRGGTLRVRELLRAVLELVDMLDGGPEFADGLQTARDVPFSGEVREADDGVRTRDPQLGKLMLYQLSYVRVRLRVTDSDLLPGR
jgi:hypothetical protein